MVKLLQILVSLIFFFFGGAIGSFDAATAFAQMKSVTVHLDMKPNDRRAGFLYEKVMEQVDRLSQVEELTVTGHLYLEEGWQDHSDSWTLKEMEYLKVLDLSGVVELKHLDSGLMSYKQWLHTVRLPEGLEYIDSYCFRESHLAEINIPSTVHTIQESAFDNTQISAIEFPASLRSIEWRAFANTSLVEAILPEGLERIGEYSFHYNRTLKKVVLPETLTYIGPRAFENCFALEELVLPTGLRHIPYEMCTSCGSLKSLTFPKSLVTVGAGAFRWSGLESADLPSSVTFIGTAAFGEMEGMKELRLRSHVPPFPSLDHQWCSWSNVHVQDGDGVLYLPLSRKEAYLPYIKEQDLRRVEWFDEPLPDELTFVSDVTYNLEHHPEGYQPSLTLSYFDLTGQYASLNVMGDGFLSLRDFNIHYGPHTLSQYYGAENKAYTTLITQSPMRADRVHIEQLLPTDCWLMQTLPFNTRVRDIRPREGFETFVVRTYDCQARAEGRMTETWSQPGPDDILEAGHGFALYVSGVSSDPTIRRREYATLDFYAINDGHKNDIFTTGEVTIPLMDYDGNRPHNSHWNFVGNPYPCYYDTYFLVGNSPITLSEHHFDGSWYGNPFRAYTPRDDAYILSPGEAFFVQKPERTNALILRARGRQHSLYRRIYTEEELQSRAPAFYQRTVYNLQLTDGTASDVTRLVVNDGAALDYELDCDASKFWGDHLTYPVLYTVEGAVEYAINERPLADGTAHLAYYVPTPGTYTLSLYPTERTPDLSPLWLTDHETGAVVRLDEGNYQFSATPGKNVGRFTLHLEDPTGLLPSPSSLLPSLPSYLIDGRRVSSESWTKGTPSIIVSGGKKIIR